MGVSEKKNYTICDNAKHQLLTACIQEILARSRQKSADGGDFPTWDKGHSQDTHYGMACASVQARPASGTRVVSGGIRPLQPQFAQLARQRIAPDAQAFGRRAAAPARLLQRSAQQHPFELILQGLKNAGLTVRKPVCHLALERTEPAVRGSRQARAAGKLPRHGRRGRRGRRERRG